MPMKEDRNHLTASRVLTFLTFVFSAIQANAAKPPEGFEKIDQEIVITTLEAKMMYDKPSFSVKPNAKIKLVCQDSECWRGRKSP